MRYVRRFSRSADAEDIAQEAFARRLKAFGDQRAVPDTLFALVKRIARNLVIDEARRAVSRPQAPAEPEVLEETASQAPDLGDAVGQRMELAAVKWALHAEGVLTDKQRTVLLLDAGGQTPEEIAHALGLNDVAVRALRHRAREAIRTELDPHEQALRLLVDGETLPKLATALGLNGGKAARRLLVRVRDARRAMGVLDPDTDALLRAAIDEGATRSSPSGRTGPVARHTALKGLRRTARAVALLVGAGTLIGALVSGAPPPGSSTAQTGALLPAPRWAPAHAPPAGLVEPPVTFVRPLPWGPVSIRGPPWAAKEEQQ